VLDICGHASSWTVKVDGTAVLSSFVGCGVIGEAGVCTSHI
jgi:hypothetical protein